MEWSLKWSLGMNSSDMYQNKNKCHTNLEQLPCKVCLAINWQWPVTLVYAEFILAECFIKGFTECLVLKQAYLKILHLIE